MRYSIITIKGGFGNQLFQYCLANSLKSLGVKVKLNIDFYDKNRFDFNNNTYRDLIFEPNFFQLKEKNLFDDIILKIRNIGHRFNLNLFQFFKGYEFQHSNLKTVNIFDGYWQNKEILIENKNFLVNELSKIELIKNNLENTSNLERTMIHVRRNDYLGMGEELNSNFYEKSLDYLNKNINKLSYDVFTDDEEWVKNNTTFSEAENIYGEKYLENNPIKIFSKMLLYNNFIVGNSTFSLLAAFLKESSSSIIIVADPWFRKIQHPGFLFDNWISIKNT